MILEDWQLKLMNRRADLVAVHHAYWFVKNNQKMSSAGFMEVCNKIRDLCGSQDVKWAILMMAHGTYVFTDKPMQVDPIMFKLTDGINFEGEITDAKGIISQVNTYLGGRTE